MANRDSHLHDITVDHVSPMSKVPYYVDSAEIDALASAVKMQLASDNAAPQFLRDIYDSEQDVIDHVHHTYIRFSPKLLAHLLTGEIPTASQFTKEIFPVRHGWGLYVVTMASSSEKENTEFSPDDDEKENREFSHSQDTDFPQQVEFRLYMSSCTESSVSIPARFADYDRLSNLPMGVRDAYAAGLHMISRSLIAWSPLPKPADIPRTRILFLTLEATFSHVFAMHLPNYHVALSKAFWDPDDLDYTGLCGHSSLQETWQLQKKLGLTAEQIEEEYQARVLRRASPEYKALRNAAARLYYANNRERLQKYHLEWNQQHAEANRARSKKYTETGQARVWKSKYKKSEKGKEKSKEYNTTDERKEYMTNYMNQYNNTDERKEYMKNYMNQPGRKEKANAASRRRRAEKKEALKMKNQARLNFGGQGSLED